MSLLLLGHVLAKLGLLWDPLSGEPFKIGPDCFCCLFLLSCEKGLIKDRKRRREKKKKKKKKLYSERKKERKKEGKKDAAAHFVSIVQWLKYV